MQRFINKGKVALVFLVTLLGGLSTSAGPRDRRQNFGSPGENFTSDQEMFIADDRIRPGILVGEQLRQITFPLQASPGGSVEVLLDRESLPQDPTAWLSSRGGCEPPLFGPIAVQTIRGTESDPGRKVAVFFTLPASMKPGTYFLKFLTDPEACEGPEYRLQVGTIPVVKGVSIHPAFGGDLILRIDGYGIEPGFSVRILDTTSNRAIGSFDGYTQPTSQYIRVAESLLTGNGSRLFTLRILNPGGAVSPDFVFTFKKDWAGSPRREFDSRELSSIADLPLNQPYSIEFRGSPGAILVGTDSGLHETRQRELRFFEQFRQSRQSFFDAIQGFRSTFRNAIADLRRGDISRVQSRLRSLENSQQTEIPNTYRATQERLSVNATHFPDLWEASQGTPPQDPFRESLSFDFYKAFPYSWRSAHALNRTEPLEVCYGKIQNLLGRRPTKIEFLGLQKFLYEKWMRTLLPHLGKKLTRPAAFEDQPGSWYPPDLQEEDPSFTWSEGRLLVDSSRNFGHHLSMQGGSGPSGPPGLQGPFGFYFPRFIFDLGSHHLVIVVRKIASAFCPDCRIFDEDTEEVPMNLELWERAIFADGEAIAVQPYLRPAGEVHGSEQTLSNDPWLRQFLGSESFRFLNYAVPEEEIVNRFVTERSNDSRWLRPAEFFPAGHPHGLDFMKGHPSSYRNDTTASDSLVEFETTDDRWMKLIATRHIAKTKNIFNTAAEEAWYRSLLHEWATKLELSDPDRWIEDQLQRPEAIGPLVFQALFPPDGPTPLMILDYHYAGDTPTGLMMTSDRENPLWEGWLGFSPEEVAAASDGLTDEEKDAIPELFSRITSREGLTKAEQARFLNNPPVSFERRSLKDPYEIVFFLGPQGDTGLPYVHVPFHRRAFGRASQSYPFLISELRQAYSTFGEKDSHRLLQLMIFRAALMESLDPHFNDVTGLAEFHLGIRNNTRRDMAFRRLVAALVYLYSDLMRRDELPADTSDQDCVFPPEVIRHVEMEESEEEPECDEFESIIARDECEDECTKGCEDGRDEGCADSCDLDSECEDQCEDDYDLSECEDECIDECPEICS